MIALLKFLSLIVALDSPHYRERERASSELFRSTFPARLAVVRSLESIAPPEVSARAGRIASLWFRDQVRADAREILEAVRRPKSWRVCDRIERERDSAGVYDRWAPEVWALIGPELHNLYPANWIAFFECEKDEPIRVGALSGVLFDLHMHARGECDW